MNKRKHYLRRRRGFCLDFFRGNSESPIDKLYRIIKKINKENPASSKEIYLRACEYKD